MIDAAAARFKVVAWVLRAVCVMLWCVAILVGVSGVAVAAEPRFERVELAVGVDGVATWWLPGDADAWVLPVVGGVEVRRADLAMRSWLLEHQPFHLLELPVVGATRGGVTTTAIVPWPHYAQIVVGESGDDLAVGVRFVFPERRLGATLVEVVIAETEASPIAPAMALRAWRDGGEGLGGVPPRVTLADKAKKNPNIDRLLGAPHLYLWGNALFSRQDVPRRRWIAVAESLRAAPAGATLGRLTATFTDDERAAVAELASADWPMGYLTRTLAAAIDRGLRDPAWLDQPADRSLGHVIDRNREALVSTLPNDLADPATWGGAMSPALLVAMERAGIDQALLLLSNLYADTPRPDFAAAAERAGYLLGRYDSYHSVHAPHAGPNDTWDTAQFDRMAYEQGRVIRADGAGKPGFRGRGYHFAPSFAEPYVKRRIGGVLAETPQTAWFFDCDAAYEYFDDYRPGREATRLDDVAARLARLRWAADAHGLVVGSEGGSLLFANAIAFGHGVHTPYFGHHYAGYRDRSSPYFGGRHWPPDQPDQSFKPIPLPDEVVSPYFDPAARVPLYQAAARDEVVTSHHWAYDSIKLSNVAATRELMELLYLVPPMLHVSRATFVERHAAVADRFKLFAELHGAYGFAPMVSFEHVTDDRLVQRTVFDNGSSRLTLTANFAPDERAGIPGRTIVAHDAAIGRTVTHRAAHTTD
ncbi:MAG: glycoside hydrolase [Planctomycetota bacterium]